jgi:hypothetical protein
MVLGSAVEGNIRGERPELKMKISLNALEHLGLKMYTSLPAVIAEFVANSWDAGATLVDIQIPETLVDESYVITIEDNGIGMTTDDINRKFLVVGRDRRKEEGTDEIEVNGKTRHVIGRKGIGKLAGFGVAGQVEVRTRKDGKFVEFRMDYDKIQQKASETNRDIPTEYLPDVLDWGSTEEGNGTIVKLKHLKRERQVNVSRIRRNLARHFSVIGRDFVVRVNGDPITPAERALKEQCEWVWTFEEEPISEGSNLKVNGWIGTMEDPVPPDLGRGVVVMARGKLIQEATTFDVGGKGITGQHALAYLVGELHAEFLDAEEDFIATGRRSVIWENWPASRFREWANEKIKKVCAEWVEKRQEKKMEKVREFPAYKERIAKLPTTEKKIVDGILGKIAAREDVEPETIEKVANFLAEGVEYQSFLALIEAVERGDVAKPEELIKFFEEWEILDALETIRVVEGRLKVIKRFRELIELGVKEVPTLHRFLADNPWLLDPTWDYLDDEVYYRDELWKKFGETRDTPEDNRRIDFLCLGYGETLNIIELKRPGSTIGIEELTKLQRYYYEVKGMLGTGPGSYKTVVAYIIGEHLARTSEVREMVEDLAKNNMFVRLFADLERVVWKVHRRFVEVLERKAKRIRDERLLEGLERLREEFKKRKT